MSVVIVSRFGVADTAKGPRHPWHVLTTNATSQAGASSSSICSTRPPWTGRAQQPFGLLVDDLDEIHTKALAAGATKIIKPQDAQGMPRNSAVKDPSGNWIWIYQG